MDYVSLMTWAAVVFFAGLAALAASKIVEASGRRVPDVATLFFVFVSVVGFVFIALATLATLATHA